MAGIGEAILGFIACIFCFFLFIAVMYALVATLELLISLATLPGTLVSLLVGYGLRESTSLTGKKVLAAQATIVGLVFAATAAVVALMCAGTPVAVLSAAAGGFLYGAVSGLFEWLESRVSDSIRK